VTNRLQGKRALITGASRGIGAEIARAFAKEGAELVLVARSQTALDALQKEIGSGPRIEIIAADLSELTNVPPLAARVWEALGGLDIIVNNAGASEPIPSLIVAGDQAGWDKVQRLNIGAPLAILRAIGPHLLSQGSGSIINVASTLALLGSPLMGSYAASKAALLSLTRTLAAEWGPGGIRVNAVAPGPTETEMTAAMRAVPEMHAHYAQRIPLRRWGRPQEMAATAVFLASDEASFITGQTLIVDGGLSTVHP